MIVLAAVAAAGAARAAAPSRVVVRMAELEIDPAQRADYDRLLSEEIATSVRVEPGVLSLNAMSVKGKPGSVRIMEVYADQAAYEAHIRSPHFLIQDQNGRHGTLACADRGRADRAAFQVGRGEAGPVGVL